MNKRFVGVLIFAFVVATAGGLLTYRSLLSRAPQNKPQAVTVKIALAAKNLEMGTVLKEEDIQLADWPGVPPAGSTPHVQDLVGRGVLNTIYAKEPVLETRLAPKGAGGGLAAMIPPGMRAVAVRVNDVAGVAGFVVPGMRVDVLISGTTPNATGNLGTLTKTLLQNIEVLSAGQDFKKDNEGKPIMVQVINLLVTPDQAEQLSLASSQTTIQLILRNPLDRQVAKPPGTALSLLFSGGALSQSDQPRPVTRPRPAPVRQAAPEAPKPAPFVMEIFSGTKKSEAKFENNREVK